MDPQDLDIINSLLESDVVLREVSKSSILPAKFSIFLPPQPENQGASNRVRQKNANCCWYAKQDSLHTFGGS